MRRPSLRLLLMVSVLATITVGFGAFAIYIDHVEQDNRLADLDDELIRAERTGFERRNGGPTRIQEVEPGLAGGVASPPVQLLLTGDGQLIDSAGGVNPFNQQTLQTVVSLEGAHSITDPNYRVRTVPINGNVMLTALPLEDFQTAVDRFRLAFLTGGAIILALVAVVLWLVTGYITRPVTQLARVATRIADGELGTKVGTPSGSKESAKLAVDLDRMLSRLSEALGEAVDARNTMERFLADMAHEIRTPLTALQGYSELYAQGMLEQPVDVDRAMSRIGSESERLCDLANGMLQLASNRNTDDTFEDFDVVETVDGVVHDLRAAYPDQQIELDCDLGGNKFVHGVQSKIHQAILNLGSNACRYNSASEPILIIVAVTEQECVIRVIDHGLGINAADIDKIFLPFYRSDTARSRDGVAGAGLGLTLTKQIADQHQGQVSAKKTPGGGATFTLKIPRTCSVGNMPTRHLHG